MSATVPRSLTLERYFAEVYLPQHDLRKLTRYHYQAAIRCLDRWHGSPVTLDTLTDELVSAWLTAMLEANVARKTVKEYRQDVLALWRFGWQTGVLPNPPRFIKRIKIPKRIPSAWTLEQLGAILAAARLEPGEYGRKPAAHFWEALILTMYDCGARISALMHTRTSDVDLQARTLILRAEFQKTGRDEVFTLSPQTVEALKRIWSHGRDLVFGEYPYGWGLHDWKALYKVYRRILHRAKLPASRRDMFHKVRRTTATQLAIALGNSLEAAVYLHHSSAELTERSYIDASQLPIKAPADVLPRPAAKGGAS